MKDSIVQISFGYKNKIYIQINFVLNQNKVLQFMNVQNTSKVNFLSIDKNHWLNKYLRGAPGARGRFNGINKKYILIFYKSPKKN